MKAGKTDNSGRMKTVFFAVFLAFAVFGAEPVFCAEQAEQEKPDASSGAVGDLSQLIGPDEYLGIAAGTYRSAGGILPEMMIRYYDSSGALQRETVSHIGEFMGSYKMGNYCVISKDSLQLKEDNNDIILLRTEDDQEIRRYRSDDLLAGRVSSTGEHAGILLRDGSRLEIYDGDGQIIADLQTDGAPGVTSDADMTDEIRIGMFEPEGCLYVRLMKGEQMLLTALIHEDGRVLTSKDASFPEIFCREQVCGIIGKNLIIGYEPDGMADRDRYLIVSPEGEVLYRDAEIHWITYGSFQKWETQKADLAILHEGDTWRILDESLAETGRIHEADLDEKGICAMCGALLSGCRVKNWEEHAVQMR